jgi:hypothetical protein
VTVVGKVLSIAERGGSLDLRVSDGTGATDLQFFGDAVEDVSGRIRLYGCPGAAHWPRLSCKLV